MVTESEKSKHGITDADLDRMAAPYEDGSFEPEPDGKVFSGSHLDAVGTRRVTVVYDAKDTQRVASQTSPIFRTGAMRTTTAGR